MAHSEHSEGTPASVVCFTCGRAVTDPPSFELMEEEDRCIACMDRLLHSLPSILQLPRPAASATPEPSSVVVGEEEGVSSRSSESGVE